MSDFVKVTAKREQSEISVIVADNELQKLYELACALPNNMTWSAVRVDGQSHRSASVTDTPT